MKNPSWILGVVCNVVTVGFSLGSPNELKKALLSLFNNEAEDHILNGSKGSMFEDSSSGWVGETFA